MGQHVQPIVVDTDDIAAMLKINKKHAQQLIRENREVLKPFKLGREIRIDEENWNSFYEGLLNAKNN